MLCPNCGHEWTQGPRGGRPRKTCRNCGARLASGTQMAVTVHDALEVEPAAGAPPEPSESPVPEVPDAFPSQPESPPDEPSEPPGEAVPVEDTAVIGEPAVPAAGDEFAQRRGSRRRGVDVYSRLARRST